MAMARFEYSWGHCKRQRRHLSLRSSLPPSSESQLRLEIVSEVARVERQAG
jgi:hypothetical protein